MVPNADRGDGAAKTGQRLPRRPAALL